AHATMLGNVGVITKEEAQTLVKGLEEILEEIEAGHVTFNPADEDIHMNMEVLLTEKVGDVGKKLHTGRSRNDQVALDMRMYLRHEVVGIQEMLIEFLETLLSLAKQHKETAMPGYTHLQRAQPITLAHHLMAYYEMFKRDYMRLSSWIERNNVMPLGSGALAGTTFPLDRNETAKALHFDGPCLNSLDGVSDRDFSLEFLSDASISMMHLSRFCEEIILWASQEFAFIDLDDAYSTGSSIMPQKKNPDVAELVRGKTGRVYGALIALLSTMKGLPLAYNKDMQEDKEGVFDTVDTWNKCLLIFNKMLATATFKETNMRRAATGGFTNATDFADYLVTKGVPFRDAHAVVGAAVAHCIMEGKSLDECTMDEMKSFSPLIEEDIYDKISIDTCIHKRQTIGAPSPQQVQQAIDINEAQLQGFKEEHAALQEKFRL
ncbi:MAG: argininosuccinate lyase, partial [Peptococcaceae bacterium]|nr:argininosuccinate lyase [Peptococcaceae bacterium]